VLTSTSAGDIHGTLWQGWRFIALALVGVLASVLLLWGLTDKYLWQDEANTAVLAKRILRFGRPLSYDGVNLITADDFSVEQDDSISSRTKNPKAAVDYYVNRGDFKADTTWKYQPLGQFWVAALSIQVLGQTTLAARLPFALASLAAIVSLYLLVRKYCLSHSMALIAAALLICNTFWILHGRQCRYYSLSSLFSLLTLAAYARWQSGARWGSAVFVAAAWCWFQVDYGTVWPVFAVLCIDCVLAHGRQVWRPALAGVALAALIAPFIFYYELLRRSSIHHGSWSYRFWFNLFNMNQYVVPALVLLAVIALLVWRWKSLPSLERRLVAIACGMIAALAIWVPAVAPDAFLRYVIMGAPAGCLLSAWLVVRGWGGRTVYAWLGAAGLIATPWLSMPLHVLSPAAEWYASNSVASDHWFRRELLTLFTEVFNPPPDPNRMVIEWLRQNTAPTDEILINYEDLPLMFYLPNPIRGGIAAFRAEDDAEKPPSVLVIRKQVPFVHWRVFAREINRYRWAVAPLKAPDVVWGNNPDPRGVFQNFSTTEAIVVARRTEEGTARGVVFGSMEN
jgi:dolichyl-phosphate-mannose-protein mannosyltransferase